MMVERFQGSKVAWFESADFRVSFTLVPCHPATLLPFRSHDSLLTTSTCILNFVILILHISVFAFYQFLVSCILIIYFVS